MPYLRSVLVDILSENNYSPCLLKQEHVKSIAVWGFNLQLLLDV